MSPEPCNCGKPIYDEDEDEPDGGWCPHWAIEDVPACERRVGDLFAIRGDLPLEVSWHRVTAVLDAARGVIDYQSVHGGKVWGPSTPFDPQRPSHVLRFGMVGRQTLAPTPEEER